MKIPKKIIKKYSDVYEKDMSKFSEEDFKRYMSMLKEIRVEQTKTERKEEKIDVEREEKL